MAKNYSIYFLLVVFLINPFQAFSANKTFTGPGNFSDATKWSGSSLPVSGDDLQIDGSCIFDDTRGLTFGRLNLGNPSPAGMISWASGSTANLIVERIQMNNNLSRIDMTNGGILTVTMSWNMGGSAALISGTGTVIFQTPSLTLPLQLTNFNNLSIQIAAGATIVLSRPTTVRGNLFITSGRLDVSSAHYPLFIGRNFINNGVFVPRSGTVTFNGTLSQQISGTTTTTFNNLTVSTFGINLLRSINVAGVLAFTSGRINTSANIVTVNPGGSVTGAAAGRYVNGFLRKTISAGSNITELYEIGNNSTYNPVSLTFATVTTTGTLTARERISDHPSLGSSCIDPLKSVNNYWTFTASGLAFTTYSATCNFTSADHDALGNPILFGIQAFSGTWQMPLTSSRTSTSTTGTGFTALGELAAGESSSPASVLVASNPGTNVCPGTSVTFTATPLNGGTVPVYQWIKNGALVGTNSPTYLDSMLNSADSIRCLVTSNNPCVFIPTVSSLSSLITPVIGVWRGVSNTLWSTATNWCGDVVPSSTDNIVINSGVPNMPVLTGNTSCNNLTLSAGANLMLSGFSLTVNGLFNATGTFTGNATSSLVINGTGGSSNLNLTQTTRADRTLQNLTINRPSSTIMLGDSLLLSGTLTLSNGSLNTSDVLRLLSSSAGTARIATITSGNITGKVTMERFLPGGTGWHLLSSPVTGCTLNDWSDDFIIGGFPGSPYPTVTNSSILTYNETIAGLYDYGYETPSGMGLALSANKGFWAYIINTPLTIDVTGNVITGDQSVSLSYTNNDASTEVGWNLIANPYPSTIDWDSPFITRTNMDAAVYLFNGGAEQYTTYVGGIGINGGSQYIPSSQGMLVQATGPGAGITFRETVKSPEDPSFMKLHQTSPQGDMLRLSVTGNGGQDETVLRFSPDFSMSYDHGYDATKLINWDANAPAICSVTGQNYSINALPPISQSYSIPLRVIVMASGIYTIKLDQHHALPSTSCITLEDKLTGIHTNFITDSTYSCYISDTTLSARFRLHISKPVEFTVYNETCHNGKAIALLPSAGICQVTWKDSANNVIKYSGAAQFADTLSNLSEGTYHFSFTSSTLQCGVLSDEVQLGRDSLTVTTVTEEPLCSNSSDGQIELTCNSTEELGVSVSKGNLVCFSDTMNSSVTINGLAEGVYMITWSNQCATDSAAVTLTPTYSVTADFLATLDTVNLNGSIDFFNTSSGAGLFMWDFGDGTLDYTSDPDHIYTVPGYYQVTLIASNSYCSDTAVKTIYVSPNSIGRYNDPSLKMYLRDDNMLVISSDNGLQPGTTLKVMSMEGKQILLHVASIEKKLELQLPDLCSGIYSVMLTTGEQISCSRFVISR